MDTHPLLVLDCSQLHCEWIKKAAGTATALSEGLASASSSLRSFGVFSSSYFHRILRGSPCLVFRL